MKNATLYNPAIVTIKFGFIGRTLDRLMDTIEDANCPKVKATAQKKMNALHNMIETVESPLYIK